MQLEPINEQDLTELLTRAWQGPTAANLVPLDGESPQPGDVARAAWDGDAALVFVVDASADTVTGHLLSTSGESTQTTRTVYDLAGNRYVAWAEPTPLPAVVFDCVLSNVATGSGPVEDWFAEQTSGPSDLSETASDTEFQELLDVTAAWDGTTTDGSLPQQIAESVITSTTQLAEILSISTQAALQLRRGRRRLTEDEATVLAPVIDIAPEQILRGNPVIPVGLRRELRRTRYRPIIDRLVQQQAPSESFAWEALAFGALNAARATDQDDWEGKLTRYIEAAEL